MPDYSCDLQTRPKVPIVGVDAVRAISTRFDSVDPFSIDYTMTYGLKP